MGIVSAVDAQGDVASAADDDNGSLRTPEAAAPSDRYNLNWRGTDYRVKGGMRFPMRVRDIISPIAALGIMNFIIAFFMRLDTR